MSHTWHKYMRLWIVSIVPYFFGGGVDTGREGCWMGPYQDQLRGNFVLHFLLSTSYTYTLFAFVSWWTWHPMDRTWDMRWNVSKFLSIWVERISIDDFCFSLCSSVFNGPLECVWTLKNLNKRKKIKNNFIFIVWFEESQKKKKIGRKMQGKFVLWRIFFLPNTRGK